MQVTGLHPSASDSVRGCESELLLSSQEVLMLLVEESHFEEPFVSGRASPQPGLD